MDKKSLAKVALFGCIWGILEATLGGLLHHLYIPFTGTIMASIGFSILYAAMKSGLRPAALAFVALAAASFKFVDPILFSLSPFEKTVINPAIAIATQGLAFALIFRARHLDARAGILALRFLAAGAVGIVAFNAISVAAFGWQTHQTLHSIATAFISLPFIAIASTIISRVSIACASSFATR